MEATDNLRHAQAIFTGLSDHDPDLAETAMIEHLEQVNQLYHQRH